MRDHDVERGRSQQLRPSSESSESSESLSSGSEERLSLLPPKFDRANSNYKSTEIVTTDEEPGENEPLEEERSTKSVVAIISLLLVGEFLPLLKEESIANRA